MPRSRASLRARNRIVSEFWGFVMVRLGDGPCGPMSALTAFEILLPQSLRAAAPSLQDIFCKTGQACGRAATLLLAASVKCEVWTWHTKSDEPSCCLSSSSALLASAFDPCTPVLQKLLSANSSPSASRSAAHFLFCQRWSFFRMAAVVRSPLMYLG